jgi:hypothetical protein
MERSLRPILPRVLVLAAILVAAGLWFGIAGRAAPALPNPDLPVLPDPNAPSQSVAPQPVAVQSLDATHFVVVTREPRLMTRGGGDGRYMNVIVYVVTHYTVQNGQLTPIEHVHVPPGWRALGAAE